MGGPRGAISGLGAEVHPGDRVLTLWAARGETGGLRHGPPLPAVIGRLEPAAPALAG